MTGTPGTGSTSDPIPSQSLSSGTRMAPVWTMARTSLWPSMRLFLRQNESDERLMESLLLDLHVRLRLAKHQPNLANRAQRKRLMILQKQIVPLNRWIWKDCTTRQSIRRSDQLSSLRSRSNLTCIALSMTSSRMRRFTFCRTCTTHPMLRSITSRSTTRTTRRLTR